MSVSPTPFAMYTGASRQFSATVSGATNSSVTWKVQEPGGGTISASGLYKAPGAVGSYHVVATSVADPGKSATATVTVENRAAMNIYFETLVGNKWVWSARYGNDVAEVIQGGSAPQLRVTMNDGSYKVWSLELVNRALYLKSIESFDVWNRLQQSFAFSPAVLYIPDQFWNDPMSSSPATLTVKDGSGALLGSYQGVKMTYTTVAWEWMTVQANAQPSAPEHFTAAKVQAKFVDQNGAIIPGTSETTDWFAPKAGRVREIDSADPSINHDLLSYSVY